MTYKIGQTVKRSDITEQSIPAFIAMRGKIVEIDNGKQPMARVHWEGDKAPEPGWRTEATIEVCEE
jgi:hypothetical protein